MTYVCNSICHKVAVSQNPYTGNYSTTTRYCSICQKFLLVFSKYCPCCGTVLRIERKNKKRQKTEIFET